MFLEILFSIVEIWFVQVKFSSIVTPKNLIAFSIFIIELFSIRLGSFSGIGISFKTSLIMIIYKVE